MDRRRRSRNASSTGFIFRSAEKRRTEVDVLRAGPRPYAQSVRPERLQDATSCMKSERSLARPLQRKPLIGPCIERRAPPLAAGGRTDGKAVRARFDRMHTCAPSVRPSVRPFGLASAHTYSLGPNAPLFSRPRRRPSVRRPARAVGRAVDNGPFVLCSPLFSP